MNTYDIQMYGITSKAYLGDPQNNIPMFILTIFDFSQNVFCCFFHPGMNVSWILPCGRLATSFWDQ